MTRSTPILYLDHSVVSREQSWPPVGEILASGKLRLALSLWNLFEIGSANDKLQRDRRLLFLEQFDPQWIRERVDVQRQEVRCFLWEKHFGVCPEQRPVLTPHLSVVNSYSAVPKARIGLTPRQWIDGVNFSRFELAKERALDALKDLQTVDKKTFRKRQHEIFRPSIGKLYPDHRP